MTSEDCEALESIKQQMEFTYSLQNLKKYEIALEFQSAPRCASAKPGTSVKS